MIGRGWIELVSVNGHRHKSRVREPKPFGVGVLKEEVGGEPIFEKL